MRTRHAPLLSAAVAIIALVAGVQANQTTTSNLKASTAGRTFLTPLPAPSVIPPGDPRYPLRCQPMPGRRCPPVLRWGGAAAGLPTIAPVIAADLPHVRVTMVLQSVVNEAVANGGVSPAYPSHSVAWNTFSPAATLDEAEYGFDTPSLPSPGDSWDGIVEDLVLFDAIKYNACLSFPTFPLSHDATILENDWEIGAFHGDDASTIASTGYYGFKYTVRVTDQQGRLSDFHFGGKINVMCTGLSYLP